MGTLCTTSFLRVGNPILCLVDARSLLEMTYDSILLWENISCMLTGWFTLDLALSWLVLASRLDFEEDWLDFVALLYLELTFSFFA